MKKDMKKRGWVYVMSNPSMPRLVKVGFTTKDPVLRAKEMSTEGVPHPFLVEYDALVYDPQKVEQRVHLKLDSFHDNKEWFRCPVSDAANAIEQIAGHDLILDETHAGDWVKKRLIDLDDPEILKKTLAEAIKAKKLRGKDKGGKVLWYAKKQTTPYSGWVKWMHDNGQIWQLVLYNNGKQDGQARIWHYDGFLVAEHIMKGQKLIAGVVWKPNGEKCPDTNVVDGNGVYLSYNEDGTEDQRLIIKDGEELSKTKSSYYKNGQKRWERTFKDDNIVTVVEWKPNGEKCPDTNVVDGNGIDVLYTEDGQAVTVTIKDGKYFEDSE